MRSIWIVFSKELKDTLRDRRTLIAMIAVPLLLFPTLIGGLTWLMRAQAEKASSKTLTVAVVGPAEALGQSFEAALKGANLEVVRDLSADSARARVEREELDAAFVFPPQFAQVVADQKPGTIGLVYKSSDDFNATKRRLTRITDAFEQQLLAARFEAAGLDRRAARALELNETNVASVKERFAQTAGGYIPYTFLLFCFMGCMYPAIDLGAGEKERGTLETLLTTPAARLHLLLGKCAVIALVGLVSALVAVLSMVLSVRLIGDIPDAILEVVNSILAPSVVGVLLTLLVPLTIFFAATQLALSFFAKSFKEAQSTISPAMILVFVPAIVGIVPGITLNVGTALVPILNVSLATKEVIAGTASVGLLALVYASLIALAALSLVAVAQLFKRESILFRS
jgi:sodium transport system permease protein